MRYSDQHIHSSCSPDSDAPMRRMAEAARDHGMAMVCFTDHIDMDDCDTGRLDPSYDRRWPLCRDTGAALRADPPPGIEVRLGMELGGAVHAPETAARAAAGPELDFVLGSFHNLRDTPDFYIYPYRSLEECRQLNRLYLAELIETAALDCFDVMAHIGYTSRYMRRDGFPCDVTPAEYGDELRTLFARLISRGKGIEVNASGLRHGHTTYPEAGCLRLYRELGGELVTVGSDAHAPEDAGVGIAEAYALLRTLGFRYTAEFKNRKPQMLPL